MLILITIITFFSTFAGGLFALRFKDRQGLILGFSAGAVIGVSFFDLLPESLSFGSKYYGIETITFTIALGFLIYMIADRLSILHAGSIENKLQNQRRGRLGAGSLSIHSFLDGIAIGLAFQISVPMAVVVALAVIAHGFSDGINTVMIILKNKCEKREAVKWLFIDSLAPVAGIVSTFFFILPASWLGLMFALFTGFFFYLGATDLLPETQHESSVWSTVMTVSGIALIYLTVNLLRS
jgi:ZIP family zinc transporter